MDLKDTISGICGAIGCTYGGLPFDVAKVRLQNQAAEAFSGSASSAATGTSASSSTPPKVRYTGVTNCMIQTLRREGPGALYKGALPALSSSVVENAVGITVHRATHRAITRLYHDPQVRFSLGTECAIGGFTGIFTCVAMCPFEVTKVRLQTAQGGNTAGLVHCVQDVYRSGGLRGFWSGLTSLWMRDIPFNAIFFGSYESICTQIMKYYGHKTKEEIGIWQVLLAGGLAGACGWSAVIPFDVAKTRLQSGGARGSCFKVMHTIATQEGYQTLFSGWSAAVARAFPANGCLFGGVEMANRGLSYWLAGDSGSGANSDQARGTEVATVATTASS
eukprot:TRINITY_DN28412_c0_g1_i1.p1 TRINITY_DN28412_c0_g1~~TRINITY_DN28412_c0_g1_i1.p1  ORF type:complete len:334 (-),score=41.21 TRINITY_DN28412_c0_g1_i1:251-1252(-)